MLCKVILCLLGLLLGVPPLYMWIATPAPDPVHLPQRLSLNPSTPYQVYVANWGFHSSIILQQPHGWQLGPPNAEEAPFVEYSWGDRRFYMESNRSPLAVLATLLLPTESVLYVRGWSRPPWAQTGVRQLYRRQVSAQQLHTLIKSIETTLQRSPSGQRPAPFPPVSQFRGRFYPGREYYIFWSDCNAWTVHHLAQAGLASSGWFVILVEQVAPHLRGFEPVQLQGRSLGLPRSRQTRTTQLQHDV